MKNPLKHNISIPLSKVVAFLDMHSGKTKGKPEDAAKIANELIEAMKEALDKLQKGFDSKNLTVCIGKAAHVDPVDLQRFISGDIPRITVYRSKKSNRHMPLYMRHTPKFYIENQPKPRANKRVETQTKKKV